MATNGLTAVYTTPDGLSIDLNNGTTRRTLTFEGVGMPPPTNWFQELPLADGAVYTGSRYARRTVTVFMLIIGDDSAGLHSEERLLSSYLEPGRYAWGTDGTQTGTLTLGWADGTVRVIDAVYRAGLEGSPDGRVGPYARKAALTFDCPRVYFKEPQAQDMLFAAVGGAAPPGGGLVNTSRTLIYGGTAPAYPTITINGPATNPYVRCTNPDGTVRTLGLNYTLGSSDILTICMERGRKNELALLNDLTDLRGYITTVSGANPEAWMLIPGSNTVLIQDQAGSPTSTAALTYTESYMVL